MKDSWTWRSLDFLVVGVFVLLIVSAAFRLWWMMLLGGVAHTICLGLEIDTWWKGYLKRASPSWKEVNQRNFADTLKFLLTRGDHLARMRHMSSCSSPLLLAW
jgi:hypothetical protein